MHNDKNARFENQKQQNILRLEIDTVGQESIFYKTNQDNDKNSILNQRSEIISYKKEKDVFKNLYYIRKEDINQIINHNLNIKQKT